jgi:CcmD family protein
MNGMVTNAVPYVIASYVITWLVIVGYAVRLYRAHTEASVRLAQLARTSGGVS